jgi:hypothetical protein
LCNKNNEKSFKLGKKIKKAPSFIDKGGRFLSCNRSGKQKKNSFRCSLVLPGGVLLSQGETPNYHRR